MDGGPQYRAVWAKEAKWALVADDEGGALLDAPVLVTVAAVAVVAFRALVRVQALVVGHHAGRQHAHVRPGVARPGWWVGAPVLLRVPWLLVDGLLGLLVAAAALVRAFAYTLVGRLLGMLPVAVAVAAYRVRQRTQGVVPPLEGAGRLRAGVGRAVYMLLGVASVPLLVVWAALIALAVEIGAPEVDAGGVVAVVVSVAAFAALGVFGVVVFALHVQVGKVVGAGPWLVLCAAALVHGFVP